MTGTCSATCGGTCPGSSTYVCPNTDAAVPEAPTIVSPIGTLLNPAIISGTVPKAVTLIWNPVAIAELYQVAVYDALTNANVYLTTSAVGSSTVTGPLNSGLYYWRARAVNTTCLSAGVTSVASVTNYFRLNSPPVLGNVILKNADSTVVAAEAGNQNHLCQLTFQNSTVPRRAIFDVNVSDADGLSDIKSVVLNWNGNSYPMSLVSSSGIGATMRATVDFGADKNNNGVFPVMAVATDSSGVGSTSAARGWKVWDCLVLTSGTL